MRCGRPTDRQLNASINLYLRMWGFPPSPSTFYRAVTRSVIRSRKVQMRRSRVAPKGGETDDMPPMNQRGRRLMCPKAYVGLPSST